jgi:excisionase family DNA binding protein
VITPGKFATDEVASTQHKHNSKQISRKSVNAICMGSSYVQNVCLGNLKSLGITKFQKFLKQFFNVLKQKQMEQILKVLMEIKKEIKDSLLQNKEVFSLREFCSYADISDDYGYKLTSQRKIRHFRPGGKKIYLAREDVVAYLLQNPVCSHSATEQAANNHLLTPKTAA